jgi:hypothetical protein
VDRADSDVPASQTAADGEPAEVEPLEIDAVRVIAIGTALWGVAFVVLLVFSGRLSDDGRGWWVWTALAGFGLGLLGIEYCRRRRDRLDPHP